MNPHDIYLSREDLMTEEERVDFTARPGDYRLPLFPRNFNMMRLTELPNPEAMEREAFERRRPALGLRPADLDSIQAHIVNPSCVDAQRRRLFSMLKNAMLRALIPTSGAASVPELLDLLREDLKSGPAAIPDWYTFSTVTMGPRKIRYDYCSNRGCMKTEDLTTKFMLCGACQVCIYCGPECQKQDWKARHKQVCKEAKAQRDQAADVGKMMQRLSDVSLVGGAKGPDIDMGSILRGLLPPNIEKKVEKRREHLEKEKERDRPGETFGW